MLIGVRMLTVTELKPRTSGKIETGMEYLITTIGEMIIEADGSGNSNTKEKNQIFRYRTNLLNSISVAIRVVVSRK